MPNPALVSNSENGGPSGQVPADGRHVEYPALPALAHGRDRQLGQVQRCQHVHLHHQPHASLGELVERSQECDGGVVDEDVRRTSPVDDLAEQALPFLGLGQVGPQRRSRSAPRGFDLAQASAEASLDIWGRAPSCAP